MADIDALIGELYPTAASAGAASGKATTRGDHGAAAPPATSDAKDHGFDDSDDGDRAPAPTKGSTTATTGARSTAAAAAAAPFATLSVPWPTLPPALAPGPQCPPDTVSLTSYASPAAEREQRRLLHLNASQLAHAKYCRPERPGLDDDGGRWCPYVRCRHCDHVVVRKQGVYWTRGLATTGGGPARSGSSGSSTPPPPQQGQQQAGPSGSGDDAGKVAGGSGGGGHSFDDSSDDEGAAPPPSSCAAATATATSESGAVSTPTTAAGLGGGGGRLRDDDAMYMLMRYHYPDFAAFPAGCLAPAPPGTAAAAYCCQCTWVSVLEAALRVPAPIAGAPPVPVPEQPTALGLEPAPTSRPAGVQWACRGHTC